MKRIVCLVVTLLIFISSTCLVGCDFLSFLNDDKDDGNETPVINNSVDLNEYVPTPDDDTEYAEDETYYTSVSIDFVTKVNGNYSIDRPFTLDKENQNKRIYRNVYFYEEDYFQVIYYKDITKLGTIYALLSDESDQQYVEVQYTEKGNPYQIDIVKKGVYDIILDIETLAIDMFFLRDIQTPVYETIKTCELKVHVSLEDYSYTAMTLNQQTNEWYIEKFIPLDASIGFYSDTHNSKYNMTVEPKLFDRYVYWSYNSRSQVQVHVGGTYKIYFNAKTYVLRLELQNPDTASYYCQVGWKENKELTPVSPTTPYLFEHELVAEKDYTELPSFYPCLGMSYDLTVIDVEDNVFNDEEVRNKGTYKLSVNLKEFTLTVEKIS